MVLEGENEMKAAATSTEPVIAEWKPLIRAGGISMLTVGAMLLFALVLLPDLAPSLSSSEVALTSLSTDLPAKVFLWILVPVDLLLVPAFLALYLALRETNRSAMLVAISILGMSLVFDFGTIGSQGLYLLSLSQSYAAATSDAQRASYVPAANYALAAFNTGFPIYSTLVPAIGFLIASLVMLKGIFRKPVAYLGIVTGVLGTVAGFGDLVPPLAILAFVFPVLFAIWFLLVGSRLYSLGGR